MALDEKQVPEGPHLSGSGSQMQLVRTFHITGYAMSTAGFVLAVGELMTSYPLGTPLTGGGRLALLRVSDYDVSFPEGAKDHYVGRVTYSTNSVTDVEFGFDIGTTMAETPEDRDSNSLGNNRLAKVYVPVFRFHYTRMECYKGFWLDGTLTGWNGGDRYTWSKAASGNPSSTGSQRQRAMSLVGKVNSDIFLGCSANTWLFMGAQVQRMADLHYHSGSYYEKFRATYQFGYRPSEWSGWQWRHPDTGVAYHVYETDQFAILDLDWAPVSGGGNL